MLKQDFCSIIPITASILVFIFLEKQDHACQLCLTRLFVKTMLKPTLLIHRIKTMFSYIIWLNSEWEQLRYVQDCVSWAQGQKVIKYVCRHTKLAVDLKFIFSRISLLLFFKQRYMGFNWNSARYLFLKSETKFQMPGQKALIWDPAMVSMIKTQLIIRQNVNKVKIQKFLLFFNCGLVLFVFLVLGV